MNINTDSGIEVSEKSGTIIITGEGINTFAMLQAWHAFCLWMKTGLQPTRGVVILKTVKKYYGFTGGKWEVAEKFARFMADGGFLEPDNAQKGLIQLWDKADRLPYPHIPNGGLKEYVLHTEASSNGKKILPVQIYAPNDEKAMEIVKRFHMQRKPLELQEITDDANACREVHIY